MMSESIYEVTADVLVPTKMKIKCENEDDAIGEALKSLGKRGISQKRISNLKWSLIKDNDSVDEVVQSINTGKSLRRHKDAN